MPTDCLRVLQNFFRMPNQRFSFLFIFFLRKFSVQFREMVGDNINEAAGLYPPASL